MRKRRIKISINAPVTLGFVFACFIVTLVGVLTNGQSTEKFFMTYHSSFKEPLTYVRFFTHVLGHSGWSHFIGNASYLLLLGPLLEERYRGRTLVWIFVITALVTALINYFLFPTVALCGASGIVFAFFFLASLTGFREGEIPMTSILVAVIFIGQQVYEGIILKDNISNMAHVVGGIIGTFVGYKLNRGGRK